MPINSLGYSCIKKLQRDNLWPAYNEPINFYSVLLVEIFVLQQKNFHAIGLLAIRKGTKILLTLMFINSGGWKEKVVN